MRVVELEATLSAIKASIRKPINPIKKFFHIS